MKGKEVLEHVKIIFFAELIVIASFALIKIITGTSVEDVVQIILESRIPVWILLITAFVGYPVFRAFYRVKINSKSTLSNQENIFDSDKSDYFDYDFVREKIWDESAKKTGGNRALADINFDDATKFIDVQRKNIDGRILIKLSKYNINGSIEPFIKKDNLKQSRNIIVEFEAKSIGLVIDLKVVFFRQNFA